MSGVSGTLTVLVGGWLAMRLPFGGWAGVVLTTAVLLVGVLLLIRAWSVHRVRQLALCITCRGAGTVYSAEWNDWSRKGPVQNVREPCPQCQGSTQRTTA